MKIRNDLDYIYKVVSEKYGEKELVTDLCFDIANDLKISYTLAFRFLRKEDFSFSRTMIYKISKAYNIDWNKMYIIE